ncbi:MAG: hypothetical protein ACREPY_03155 [Rhodanobacteraceae bacterium]
MNKRLLIVALAAACGACAISATAFAEQTTNGQSANQSVATTTAQSTVAEKGAQRAVPPLDSHACIRDTGSHIPAKKGQCLPVAGRSYTQQDIQRTGATNVGQALQMLDPSVTVHGH